MRSVATKIRPALWPTSFSPVSVLFFSHPLLARPLRSGLVLLLLSSLLASCHRKLNYRDGQYRSARDMVRMKKGVKTPARPSTRPQGKEKVKYTAANGNTTKVVTRRAVRPGNATGTLAAVIEAARSYQGTPYLFGGTTRLGLDCSGLLQLAFAEAGVDIPRSSNEQAVWGEPVKATELRPGDLVFFGASPGSRTITHVGLVTVVDDEGVDFIHASTSLGVVENSLESDYYLSRYIRAVRPRL